MRLDEFRRCASQALLQHFTRLLAHDRGTTAELLACIAEIDARRLHLRAGYSSTFRYCVEEFHLSENSTYKRIQAARAARRFPWILDAIAEGRLHLTALVMLAPHLSAHNAEELVREATHGSKAQIEALRARRFGRPDAPTSLRLLSRHVSSELESAAEHRTNTLWSTTHSVEPPEVIASQGTLVPEPVGLFSSGRGAVEAIEDPGKQDPTPAPADALRGTTDETSSSHRQHAGGPGDVPSDTGRYRLSCTLSQTAYDDLRTAQALLGHSRPRCDAARVIELALRALAERLEHRKAGSSARSSKPPETEQRGPLTRRYIPAHIRREVWLRDGGRCTFVGEQGHPCHERTRLEFDHCLPLARGGETTAANLRLRCRAHHQFEADRVFGAEFMERKRNSAGARRRSDPQRADDAGAPREAAM
jgi:5-methylcytosine-specific restriction endonuclease McrA